MAPPSPALVGAPLPPVPVRAPLPPVPLALLALGAALLLPPAAAAVPVTRNVTFTANLNEYPAQPGAPFAAGYSACWSYIHGNGDEYAILGTTGGTAIYNVTDPWAVYRVGFIPGPTSSWREAKSWRNWIYIVTEGSGAGTGLQVVRMTNPEAPVLVATYTATFTTAHTVAIDTARALLLCNGTRRPAVPGPGSIATGMRVLSIANPEAPVEISWWPGGSIPVSNDEYVHDSVPVGNRIYAASIYPGIQRVLDFTNPAGVFEIHSWNYPGGFTHNCWPDASEQWLYVTDEVNGEPLKIFHIGDVMNPTLVNAITSNPQAIVHNAHVKGSELYLSNYTEGIRILDLEDPAHPAEFGWADSYPGASGGYGGVWEVCPYFPSGTVIASDMQTGLYVYRPVRDYGIVRAVVDSGAGLPVPGVNVRLVTQGDSLTTPADGIVQFAPGPGTHTVLARKFGYYDASATRDVGVGSRDTVSLRLVRRPARGYQGTVKQAGTGTPLEDAEIDLLYTPLSTRSDALGEFALETVPVDVYQVEARCPGHRPLSTTVDLAPHFPPRYDLPMVPAATYDAFETPNAWVVGGAGTGDNATSGLWTRVEPLGTGQPAPAPSMVRRPRRLPPGLAPQDLEAWPAIADDARGRYEATGGAGGSRGAAGAPAFAFTPGASDAAGDDGTTPAPRRPPGFLHPDHEHHHEEEGAIPGEVQPEYDRTPPPGQMCWITGQGTNPGSIGESDVDGGRTSLTSPDFDLTGMGDPRIGYWRWFYATGASDDWFEVLISANGGATWVSVETTHGFQNRWEERTIRVADHVTPTSQVRVRFVAVDSGPATTVEAGVDDFIVYDATLPNVGAPDAGAPVALRITPPRPNPARGAVRFALELPRAGEARVEVLDLSGRRVRTLHRGAAPAGALALAWNGADDRGRAQPAGLYFIRAASGLETATARLVRIE